MFHLPDSLYHQIVADVGTQFNVVVRTATEGDRYYSKDSIQDTAQPVFTFVQDVPQDLEDGVMATGFCQVGSIQKDGVDYARVLYRFSDRTVYCEPIETLD